MVKKRERLEVIRDILKAINYKKKIKPTRLLQVSNLSPQMFKEYILELKEKRLIGQDTSKEIFLTEKGLEFLQEYASIERIIQNFGL